MNNPQPQPDPKLEELAGELTNLYQALFYWQIYETIERKDLTSAQKTDVILAGMRGLVDEMEAHGKE